MDWPAGALTRRASPFRSGRYLELMPAPFGAYEGSLESQDGMGYDRLTYSSVRAIGGPVLVDPDSTRTPSTQARQIMAVPDDQDVELDGIRMGSV